MAGTDAGESDAAEGRRLVLALRDERDRKMPSQDGYTQTNLLKYMRAMDAAVAWAEAEPACKHRWESWTKTRLGENRQYDQWAWDECRLCEKRRCEMGGTHD